MPCEPTQGANSCMMNTEVGALACRRGRPMRAWTPRHKHIHSADVPTRTNHNRLRHKPRDKQSRGNAGVELCSIWVASKATRGTNIVMIRGQRSAGDDQVNDVNCAWHAATRPRICIRSPLCCWRSLCCERVLLPCSQPRRRELSWNPFVVVAPCTAAACGEPWTAATCSSIARRYS